MLIVGQRHMCCL